MAKSQDFSPEEIVDFLKKLHTRFSENMHRHKDLNWDLVEEKLLKNQDKLRIVYEMEKTGGEPDVVVFNADSNEVFFCDWASESPKERRSLCYDRAALEKRKEHKPRNSAMDLASEIGIDILTEEDYQLLQELDYLDQKTSSWLKTPQKIRNLGGAIFGDRRYDYVFIYHNGADSYYAARGFRGKIKI